MTSLKPERPSWTIGILCGCALGLLPSSSVWAGEFPEQAATPQQEKKEEDDPAGQVLLDEAFELKLTARSGRDFAKIVQRCEAAIKEGLDAENEKFARQLLTSTLYQYVSGICEPILVDRPDPSWRQRRAVAMPLLKKLLSVDDQFGDALLLTARLERFPGGDVKHGRQLVEKAIVVFKEDNEKMSEALLLRAGFETNQKKKLSDLDQAIKLDTSNTEAWQSRALIHLGGGKFERAVEDLENLLKQDDDNYLAVLALAEAFANLQKPVEAIKYAERAIKLKPKISQGYELRARIYVLNNDKERALADINQSLKLEPRSLSSLLLRARLFQAEGKLVDALKDVEMVLNFRPDLQSALFLKSTIHEAQREFGKAAEAMQKVVKLDADNEQARLMLGMYYSLSSQVPAALAEFDRILEKNQGNAAALYWRADTRLNMGDHQGASQDYERVLKANPEHEATLNNLAWLLATSPEDGLRNGKRAVKLALRASESSQYKKPHILSTLAAAYAESGDYPKAIEWSTKAVKLGRADLQEQLEAELKSYQKKKPWREKKDLPESKKSEPNKVETSTQKESP